MSGKEKFYGLGRSATAGQKRNQQLEQWEKSVTNKEPAYVSSKRKNPRVRFGESVVFLAASQSGDVEEVERLLTEEGADVNSVNKDGLTALHQVEREREGSCDNVCIFTDEFASGVTGGLIAHCALSRAIGSCVHAAVKLCYMYV